MNAVFEKISCIDQNDIGYHEAHGTGTVVGDREELAALTEVYMNATPMIIGSVKSNMGHAEGASGLMGLIKILLMMEEECLYPNYGFRKSPHLPIKNGKFIVLKNVQKWEPTPCSISSFGFGGTNAFVVLLPPMSRKSLSLPVPLPRILPFAMSKSTPVPTAASNPSSPFYIVQKMLGNHKFFRYSWNGSSWQEASPLVFVLNGQGSQWENMGRELIKTNTAFISTMEKLEASSRVPLS
eukprot:1467518-Ditylum_brightwellii.AAC.1